jgi:hypothetical protein
MAVVAWASVAFGVPHGGSATEATLARFPCIHAGSQNPVVRYNATLGGVKSMEKVRFPQEISDFLRISYGFGLFSSVLAF